MEIIGEQERITDFKYEDFILSNYDPHPAIKAPISV
jgi:thymidylate synthase